MAEYIEKAALMGLIESEARRWGDDYDWWQCLSDIEDFKPADVCPVVRGRWVKDSDGLYICSECGEVALQRVFIKLPKKIVDLQMVQSAFCPNCGADMRETEE